MVSSTRKVLLLFAVAVLLLTTSRAAPFKRQAIDDSTALKNYALGLFVGSKSAVSSINPIIMLTFDYINILYCRTLLFPDS